MDNKKTRKKVMVFGVFDRLHAGHISLFEQAKKYGDTLIAVVARDSVAWELKKKLPHQEEEARRICVQDVSCVTHAVLGDAIVGSYEVVQRHQPDVICLGYDQQALERDLCERMEKGMLAQIELVWLQAHEPEKFHTSLL